MSVSEQAYLIPDISNKWFDEDGLLTGKFKEIVYATLVLYSKRIFPDWTVC